jgi:hypothetical protein
MRFYRELSFFRGKTHRVFALAEAKPIGWNVILPSISHRISPSFPVLLLSNPLNRIQIALLPRDVGDYGDSNKPRGANSPRLKLSS